jgi:hypothetical protein
LKLIRKLCRISVVALIALEILLVFSNVSSVSAATYTPSSVQAWAVIVCGGSSGGSQQEDFENEIAEAYNVLLSRAFSADHVYYLDIQYPRDVTGDGINDVDAPSNKTNVQFAITTWLASHSDSNDICFLYFVNHGADGGMFYINGLYIYSSEMASWLSTVHYGRLIFTMDACYSGDFIHDLSQANRIIACSTDGDHVAGPDPGTDWPAFSHTFFARLSSKDSIGKAFNVAYQHVRQVNSYQYPVLDDNADGVGHGGPLPNGGDGNLALAICWMPGDCNSDNKIDISDAVIVARAYGSHCSPNWDPRADCNGDWVIDDKDVQIVQAAYGSKPGDPNWDPRADCNKDGKVDILDAVIVARAYGSSCSSNWDARADLNCDWVINDSDVAIIQTNYGYAP